VNDPDDNLPSFVEVTTSETLCNHYTAEEIAQIPTATENVMATLEFLAKDDDGFFMMYEQGDVRIVYSTDFFSVWPHEATNLNCLSIFFPLLSFRLDRLGCSCQPHGRHAWSHARH
jgi:hypothetical protein